MLTFAALGISLVSASAPASAFTIKGRDEAPNEFKSIIQDFRAFVGEEARYLSPETIKAKQVDISTLKLDVGYRHVIPQNVLAYDCMLS